MIAGKGRTLLKYEESDRYTSKGGVLLPSGEEMDRIFKQKDKREVNMQNKPKNMYRWGEVIDSDENFIKKGTMVYYSQYDVEEFKKDDITYNAILNEHVLATMV